MSNVSLQNGQYKWKVGTLSSTQHDNVTAKIIKNITSYMVNNIMLNMKSWDKTKKTDLQQKKIVPRGKQLAIRIYKMYIPTSSVLCIIKYITIGTYFIIFCIIAGILLSAYGQLCKVKK